MQSQKDFIIQLKEVHDFQTHQHNVPLDSVICIAGVFYQRVFNLPQLKDNTYIDCILTQTLEGIDRIGVTFSMQLETAAGTTNIETFFNIRNGDFSEINPFLIVNQFLAIANGCSSNVLSFDDCEPKTDVIHLKTSTVQTFNLEPLAALKTAVLQAQGKFETETYDDIEIEFTDNNLVYYSTGFAVYKDGRKIEVDSEKA